MLKKILSSICCLFFITILSAQEYQLTPPYFKYLLGTQEPESSWNQLEFADSSWLDGEYSISYGYGEDSTVVEKTNSIYLRYAFNVNKDTISIMQLMVNFDDGFIAYLNGNEIARVNLGKKGDTKKFNDTTDRSREAYVSGYCNPSYAYYLDTTMVKNFLLNGDNVLAVQVHNDSIQGSDLKFECGLVDVTQGKYNIYSPLWSGIKQVDLDSTHLPILIIDTDEYRFRFCKTKTVAAMKIIDNANKYNKLTDTVFAYNGRIEIETRGESSLYFPKKNYNIELQDIDGSDTSISILNMPAENDWTLIGPFSDRSQIRNEIAYTLGRQMGMYAPRTAFCELIMNGEFQGLYFMVEEIKRDKNRVDIKKITTNDNSGIDVTGGYIFRLDKGASGIQLVYPKPDEITYYQKGYISAFYKAFTNSTLDKNLFDTQLGYKNFVDIPSYLDYTIISEVTRNPDAYMYSFYMFKDRDDINSKLQFGPLWDFDLAFGNSRFQFASSPQGWQFNSYDNFQMKHTQIFKDSILVDQLENRWKYLRSNVLHTDSVMKLIDDKVQFLGSAIDRNFSVWQVEGRSMNLWNFSISSTYNQDIAYLKSWTTDRLKWIDENIGKLYYPYTYKPVVTSINNEMETEISVAPNPFTSEVCISYYHGGNSKIKIQLSDLLGNNVYLFEEYISESGQMFQCIDVEYLSSGTYILMLTLDGKSYTQKVIKQ
ncbi:MAG: CotH kinase family protein [Bacteroidales bacterium]|nr:CotH kinase family protein [Bacteroidales bacterium]